MKLGSKNLITDVPGIKVGNASDYALRSGTTVLSSDKNMTASYQVMGGSPGTKDTDLLEPDKLVKKIDALVLSGGSAFGLDACSGVMDLLQKEGKGYQKLLSRSRLQQFHRLLILLSLLQATL